MRVQAFIISVFAVLGACQDTVKGDKELENKKQCKLVFAPDDVPLPNTLTECHYRCCQWDCYGKRAEVCKPSNCGVDCPWPVQKCCRVCTSCR